MSWKDKIPGCYGESDKLFGRHSNDRERARETIRAAKKEGASDEEIEAENREYMESQGCSEEHIKEQLEGLGHALIWVVE